MEILFQSQRVTEPALSIVLLDWSCRESFHIFDYLSAQTVDRKNFEILWIEYYDQAFGGDRDSDHKEAKARRSSTR